MAEQSKQDSVSGSGTVDYNDLTAESYLNTLESVDYGAYTFTILTESTGRFSFSNELSTTLNTAVERRNKLVSEKFNIKISEFPAKESVIALDIITKCEAGLQYCDVVSLSADTASSLAVQNCLVNLYSIPYIDYNAEYIDRNLLKMATANNNLFAIYDSASIYQNQLWCTFFNKSLAASAGLESPYSLASSGKWTWDKFLEYAHIVSRETNDSGDPVFGFCSYGSRDELTLATFATSGVELYGDTYHNQLALRTDTEFLDSVCKSVKTIINDDSFYSKTGENAKELFAKGRCGFLLYTLNFANAISELPLDWGLLPMPSFAEGSGYISLIDSSSPGLSVPSFQTDTIRTGRILNALLAASYEHIGYSFKSDLINFSLRDNQSAGMLNIIFDSAYTDVPYLYSNGYTSINTTSSAAVLSAINNGTTFANIYKREKTAFSNMLNKYFK